MEMTKVVQGLRSQTQSKNYSGLGSCPSLNSGRKPLLTRTVGSSGKPEGNGDHHEGGIFGSGSSLAVEEWVETSRGKIVVARQGDPKKPAIVTYHDLGLNYLSNFQAFFTSGAMASVLDSFCIYHVNAPGQEPGAEDLPEEFAYPTMDELSEQVEHVIHHYGIIHCIGIGVGFGANVLVRLAHRRATMIDGLVLVNCNSQSAGWLEWVYHKVNVKSLRKVQQSQEQRSGPRAGGLPVTVVDYLIWYHLGKPDSEGRALGAVSIASIYRQHFGSSTDATSARNLAMLLGVYMSRTDLGLARELAANGKSLFGSTRTLKMPVLNMTGDRSPHVDATVVFNGRLQPNKCTWMKVQDGAMILEEQPTKVAEAVKLFLQGLGHTLRGGKRNRSQSVCPVKTATSLHRRQDGETGSNVSSAVNTGTLVEGLDDLHVTPEQDFNQDDALV